MKHKKQFRQVHTRTLDRSVAKHVLGENLHRSIKSRSFSNLWRKLSGKEV